MIGHQLDVKGNPVYPKLPLATYFVNAGVSPGDAVQAEQHIRGEVRKRLIRMAREHDPGERFRYLNDPEWRARLNRDLIADVIADLGFSRAEMREIDKGLRLGLVTEERAATATVTGAHGEQEFTVESGPGNVVRDVRTGERTVVE